MILAVAIVLAQLAAPLGVAQRIYSTVITNRAWRLDTVEVTNGKLQDKTGTLFEKSDSTYLENVNRGLVEILDAGSNAFKQAETEFRESLDENPPGPSTFVKISLPPYSDASPDGRNPYGFLAVEGLTNRWYFSHPFELMPNIIAEDVFIDVGGNVRTNYTACKWVDYHGDRTNSPAPYVSQDWGRVIRMEDNPAPAEARAGTDGGYPVIIRDPHLHFGHPEHGIDWGDMLVDVTDDNGNVLHTVTGVYTTFVNGVRFEVTIRRGAFVGRKEIEE